MKGKLNTHCWGRKLSSSNPSSIVRSIIKATGNEHPWIPDLRSCRDYSCHKKSVLSILKGVEKPTSQRKGQLSPLNLKRGFLTPAANSNVSSSKHVINGFFLCDDSNGSDEPKIRVVEHLHSPWFVQFDGDGGVVSSSSFLTQSIDLGNFRTDEGLVKRGGVVVQADKDDLDATIRFLVAHLW